MLTLEDNLWKSLQGGYRVPYDVSLPLKRLEKAADRDEIEKIFDELWNELHHQGDVGLASYLAVPQLVRIARLKGLFDWSILALCSTIEQQRHLGNNPGLPEEYMDYYESGLNELRQFVISNLSTELDELTLSTALAAVATCSGQFKLGKAIISFDEDILDEFIERF